MERIAVRTARRAAAIAVAGAALLGGGLVVRARAAQEPRRWVTLDGRDWAQFTPKEKQAYVAGFLAGAADAAASHRDTTVIVAVASRRRAIREQSVDIQAPVLLTKQIDDWPVHKCRSVRFAACAVVGERCPLNDPDQSRSINRQRDRCHKASVEFSRRTCAEWVNDPRLCYKDGSVEEPLLSSGQTRSAQHQCRTHRSA